MVVYTITNTIFFASTFLGKTVIRRGLRLCDRRQGTLFSLFVDRKCFHSLDLKTEVS